MVRSSDAKALARYSTTANGQDELPEALTRAAESIRAQVLGALRPARASSGRPLVALVPMLVGAAVVAGGAVLWSFSNGRSQALLEGNSTVVGADPAAFAQTARVERVSGIALAAVGSAALIAGTLWLLLAGNESDSLPVAVSVSPHGATFGWSTTW